MRAHRPRHRGKRVVLSVSTVILLLLFILLPEEYRVLLRSILSF